MRCKKWFWRTNDKSLKRTHLSSYRVKAVAIRDQRRQLVLQVHLPSYLHLCHAERFSRRKTKTVSQLKQFET